MARVTVEDCIDKVESPYELVLVAKERATQLNAGVEPSLDRDNATALIESLKAYQQVSQCAVLLATHDASLAAMADRIIQLPSPS